MSNTLYSINSDRNQPWNALPPLPIAKDLYKTIEVLEALGQAKLALGRLQGRSVAIPNPGMLINTISLQEAKASSAIENIFTTDDDLYRAYSEDNFYETTGPSKEVLYYRQALWAGYEHLQQQDFDMDYLIQMYRTVKQSSDGIRPPFTQIVIRRGDSGPQAGQVIYTPPRGAKLIEEKLQNLLNFLNNDEQYAVDPLLKMAIGHFQFEAIHPFRDGNGRTGRLLNIHYLTKKGLLDLPILFLSRYIIENKSDYYAYLAGVSQRGDWKAWIQYMLKAVEITSNITYQKINDIIATKDAILEVVEKETEIRRPEQLILAIFNQPLTKVKHLTDRGYYAENTARNYLNQLNDMGILEKKSIEGHHYYLNQELYRILAE
ncbi:Fic family protein [Catalinimonas alkaloidigena]|uniref:Fic family protein n=1 Tax=Catalinimonas alkaloidigena TaxID=1075417 RepID=UPI0024073E14|nr:Fic family protein [Catalinimonas alkaloidigena]MDF9794933.1 Fic family protein [Catalinimonas alkaloidigena]